MKSINLDKSMSYFKKISLTFAKKRFPIYDKEYHFLIFVGAVSFRDKSINAKKIKEKIKTKIRKEISKINNQKISDLYKEKLIVRLELYLPSKYLMKTDIDNVAKTVLDCMNKLVYNDDKQVYSLDIIKSKAKNGAIGVTIGRFICFSCSNYQ